MSPEGIATVAGKVIGGIIKAIQEGRATKEILDIKLSDLVDGKEIELARGAAERSKNFEQNG